MDAEFDGAVHFRRAELDSKADFSAAKFASNVYFDAAAFGDDVYFEGAEFVKNANFMSALYASNANFSAARFGGDASFTDVKFKGDADFFLAKFSGRLQLMDSEFALVANFRRVRFDGDVNFDGAKFHRDVTLEEAKFGGGANFRRVLFPSQNSDLEFGINDVTLLDPRRIRFEDVDLSRASFRHTDVSQVQFVGCRWAAKTEPRFWLIPFWKQDRNAIYDELFLDQRTESGESREPGEEAALVAETYRQLRINFEASRQEVEAGDFYVGQMEMRRQNPSERWLVRLQLNIYRALANYGESYVQPFVWYALIFAPLFALAYWRLGDVSYADGLFSAITAGFLFRFEQLPAGIENWEKLLVFFNMAVDILLVTLIVIALRRRFHR